MNVFFAEFLGTLLLLLLGNGVVANVLLSKSKGEGSGWIVISTGWAFAVAIGVYLSGWVSGGHLNPAITIAFAFIGKTAWALVPFYLLGQCLGAMAGAFLVYLAYLPHWSVTENETLKLLCFSTKPAIRKPVANFLNEMIGTAVLVLGVLAILNPHNQMRPDFTPYAIGILIFSIGLSLGGPTGFAINPARDLGPRIVHSLLQGHSDWGYAWIPVVGPIVGGILGALIYVSFLSFMA